MTAVASAIAVGDVTYESIMIWTQRGLSVARAAASVLLYFGLLTWLVSTAGRWLRGALADARLWPVRSPRPRPLPRSAPMAGAGFFAHLDPRRHPGSPRWPPCCVLVAAWTATGTTPVALRHLWQWSPAAAGLSRPTSRSACSRWRSAPPWDCWWARFVVLARFAPVRGPLALVRAVLPQRAGAGADLFHHLRVSVRVAAGGLDRALPRLAQGGAGPRAAHQRGSGRDLPRRDPVNPERAMEARASRLGVPARRGSSR